MDLVRYSQVLERLELILLSRALMAEGTLVIGVDEVVVAG